MYSIFLKKLKLKIGPPVFLEGHGGAVVCTMTTSDKIVSGSYDGTIRLWKKDEKEKWNQAKVLIGHIHIICRIVFAGENDRYIISGSDDGTIMCWDSESGERLYKLSGHDYAVQGLLLLAHTDLFAAETFPSDKVMNGALDLLDRQVMTLNIEADCNCIAVTVGASNKRMASGHNFPFFIRIWDPAPFCLSFNNIGSKNISKNVIRQIKALPTCHTESICCLCYSDDGTCLASGSLDGLITIYTIKAGDVYNLSQTLKGHTGWVMSIAFKKDSTTLVSGSDDKSIKVWDVALKKDHCLQQTLTNHVACINSVAISSDNSSIVSGGDDSMIMITTLL